MSKVIILMITCFWRYRSVCPQLVLPIILYVFSYFLGAHLPHQNVYITEPYYFEKSLFNINFLGMNLTINEWLQFHRTLFLDTIASISYISFFFIFILIASYLYIEAFNRDQQLKLPIGWALFWLGIAYLMTSHLYPVAPPWYITDHGLSSLLTSMQVHAHSQACDNFDNFISYQLCGNYIGNGPYPYGAMPSTHVGIPLLLVYFAIKRRKLVVTCITFYLLEIFATLYMNQHYLIDLIAGTIYALIICICVDKYYTSTARHYSLTPQA